MGGGIMRVWGNSVPAYLRGRTPYFAISSFARGKIEGRYRLGLLSGEMEVARTEEFVQLMDFTPFHDEIRIIDEETLIGKWVSPELNPDMLRGLGSYLEPHNDRFAFYYILKRANTGASIEV